MSIVFFGSGRLFNCTLIVQIHRELPVKPALLNITFMVVLAGPVNYRHFSIATGGNRHYP